MQVIDAVEQLVLESQRSVGVLGHSEDFVLFRLDPAGLPLDASALADATSRGLSYCGVLGLTDERVRVLIEIAKPGAALTMCYAGIAFGHLFADEMRSKPKPEGDAVQWLYRLAELPDVRH